MNLITSKKLIDTIQVDIQALNLNKLLQLKQDWLTLEENSEPSFFLSWKWIGNWLKLLNTNDNIRLLSASKNNQLVALGIFVERDITRNGCIKAKQWLLHRTGNECIDQIWIENNNFLIQAQDKKVIEQAIWRYLTTHQQQVDEFILNVAKAPELTELSSSANQYQLLLSNNELGHNLELSKYFTIDDYLNSLSKNTRQQIKRSLKLLAATGEIKFQLQTDSQAQLKLLEQTQKWHIAKWINTDTPSGFTNPIFIDFHRLLINTDHHSAKTLISQLTLNNEILGSCYYFQQGDKVYFYLSCLKPANNNRIKLGLIMHYLMVEWLITNNHTISEYDFLAGDARYKRSLANKNDSYTKITIQKQTTKFAIEAALKQLKERLTQYFSPKNSRLW